jgi:hypothetical protein
VSNDFPLGILIAFGNKNTSYWNLVAIKGFLCLFYCQSHKFLDLFLCKSILIYTLHF